MVEEDQKAIWNVDGAQLYVIFQIKTEASIYLTNWDLENSYWRLRDLRREVDAKLNRKKIEKCNVRVTIDGKTEIVEKNLTQKEKVDYLLDELTKEREIFLISEKDVENYSRFYLVLEEFYMLLSELMKEHGLWLREGEDPSQAFRRR